MKAVYVTGPHGIKTVRVVGETAGEVADRAAKQLGLRRGAFALVTHPFTMPLERDLLVVPGGRYQLALG